MSDSSPEAVDKNINPQKGATFSLGTYTAVAETIAQAGHYTQAREERRPCGGVGLWGVAEKCKFG